MSNDAGDDISVSTSYRPLAYRLVDSIAVEAPKASTASELAKDVDDERG